MTLLLIGQYLKNNALTIIKALGILILVIAAAVYIQKLRGNLDRLHEDLIGKDQKYKQLTDYVAALEIQYKDQQELAAKAREDFGKQADALRGKIKLDADSTFTNGDDKAHVIGKLSLPNAYDVGFPDGPSLGYVKIDKDGQVSNGLYKLDLLLNLAYSQDESTGRGVVLSRASIILRDDPANPLSAKWKDKPYPLKISSGVTYIDPTEPNQLRKSFSFWNPKFNANLNLTPNGLAPGAGLSVMSYGNSKNDADFKFLEFGVQDLSNKFGLTISPVMWRPLSGIISNTYVGPGIYVQDSGISYYLGFTIGL
jgi:hypothetical protein